MSVAEDLGKLIILMNPYTSGSATGMDPHMFVDAFDIYTSPPSSPPSGSSDPKKIWMEVDKRYPGEWTFKGQPHHVNTALRIAYRWARKDNIWITDYLLIGYEGANGGG